MNDFFLFFFSNRRCLTPVIGEYINVHKRKRKKMDVVVSNMDIKGDVNIHLSLT